MTFFENFEAEETSRLLADPHKSFNSARYCELHNN